MTEGSVRPAHVGELEELSDLALRSKGHWGYSAEFLEACRDELSVKPADLERLEVRVFERDGRVLGFYGLDVAQPEGELWWLFVDPRAIRTGAGAVLWNHAVARARDAGVSRMRIEADPFAEGFYLAMGATRVGEVASGSIGERSLPLLVYDIPRVD